MTRWRSAERLAPIIAGLAGLAWFWLELAPQRTGFEDTDDPAIGLAFINAHATAWPMAGVVLGITAVALVVTVLAMRTRLGASRVGSSGSADPGIAIDTITVVGIMAAAALFGMAAVRMSGGPVRYVQGLDQAWGEAAYLVTQFVGLQALVTGGLVLLELWLVGVAWLAARRGVISRVVALLAALPAMRLIGVVGPFGLEFEGGWLLVIAAIPATFAWLVLLGATIRAPAGMTAADTLAASAAARGGGGEHLEEAPA